MSVGLSYRDGLRNFPVSGAYQPLQLDAGQREWRNRIVSESNGITYVNHDELRAVHAELVKAGHPPLRASAMLAEALQGAVLRKFVDGIVGT